MLLHYIEADHALNVSAATAVGEARAQKRPAVMDRGGDKVKIGADYVQKSFPKQEHIAILLRGIVSSNVLFSSYTTDEQAAIVAAFESTNAVAGTFVIRQDTEGDVFYVVESGTLDIFVKNSEGVDMKVGAPLGTASSFGELALMYNTPRAASIKAATDCKLWKIDRDTYRGIVLNSKYVRNKQYMEFLKNVEIRNKKLGVLMSESKFGDVFLCIYA
jgi:CRP-like cAMP-binding protein